MMRYGLQRQKWLLQQQRPWEMHILKVFKCTVDIFLAYLWLLKNYSIKQGAMLTCKVWHSFNTQNTENLTKVNIHEIASEKQPSKYNGSLVM